MGNVTSGLALQRDSGKEHVPSAGLSSSVALGSSFFSADSAAGADSDSVGFASVADAAPFSGAVSSALAGAAVAAAAESAAASVGCATSGACAGFSSAILLIGKALCNQDDDCLDGDRKGRVDGLFRWLVFGTRV